MALGFVLGAILLDRGVGSGLGTAFSEVRSGIAGRANNALAHKDAELMVFGSSRAIYHIDPAVLESEMGITAFNAGAPGQGVGYALGLQRLLISRKSRARYHLLHLDPKNLWNEEWGRVLRLAPYYGEDHQLDALLERAGPWMQLKLWSHVYRYNGLALPMLENLLRPEATEYGFERLPHRPYSAWETTPNDMLSPDPGPIDPALRSLFVDFVRNAEQHGSEAVFVDGPRWPPGSLTTEQRLGRGILRDLAKEQGVVYIEIDALRYPIFADRNVFYDTAHLNYEGAATFSRILAQELTASGIGAANLSEADEAHVADSLIVSPGPDARAR